MKSYKEIQKLTKKYEKKWLKSGKHFDKGVYTGLNNVLDLYANPRSLAELYYSVHDVGVQYDDDLKEYFQGHVKAFELVQYV